ncbi:MAG: nuclear transport factor 2 family protein, partial [Pseudomonadota bacterium]
MKRRALFAAAAIALAFGNHASAPEMDATSQATFDTVMAFMGAMGKGDTDTMAGFMADDMVWHNEGDKDMPWIGPWQGK